MEHLGAPNSHELTNVSYKYNNKFKGIRKTAKIVKSKRFEKNIF
jgi:hypothetical protein